MKLSDDSSLSNHSHPVIHYASNDKANAIWLVINGLIAIMISWFDTDSIKLLFWLYYFNLKAFENILLLSLFDGNTKPLKHYDNT